jgi:hypothetical protein
MALFFPDKWFVAFVARKCLLPNLRENPRKFFFDLNGLSAAAGVDDFHMASAYLLV